MSTYTYIANAAFALAAVAADELRALGMREVHTGEGFVTFSGTQEDAARACINLRSADRVARIIGTFTATDFDALFEGIAALPWKSIVGRHGRINISAACRNSTLMSPRDVQSISKKAVIRALCGNGSIRLPEDGEPYAINIGIVKDTATVTLDLCGDGLHKRGYRTLNAAAPLRETTAAAILLLAGFDGTQAFADPFCGSGTLPIEAALIAGGIAPGKNRAFDAEKHFGADASVWKRQRAAAADAEKKIKVPIICGDILKEMTEMTAFHADRAGVAAALRIRQGDAKDFDTPLYGGLLVSNPPYGERLQDRKTSHELLCGFEPAFRQLREQYWSVRILTQDAAVGMALREKPANTRRVFNSNLACTLYGWD